MARKELDADEKFGLAWILGWPIYGIVLIMAMNFFSCACVMGLRHVRENG